MVWADHGHKTSGEILNYKVGCLKLLDFAEALVLSPIEWFLMESLQVCLVDSGVDKKHTLHSSLSWETLEHQQQRIHQFIYSENNCSWQVARINSFQELQSRIKCYVCPVIAKIVNVFP